MKAKFWPDPGAVVGGHVFTTHLATAVGGEQRMLRFAVCFDACFIAEVSRRFALWDAIAVIL